MEHFTAFYSPRPFWAVQAVDMSQDKLPPDIKNLLSEVVYRFDGSDFAFSVCRDGLIMLRIQRLEEDPAVDDFYDFDGRVNWWGKYLDYVNCVHLLLDGCEIQVMGRSFTEFSEVTRRDVFRVTIDDDKISSESFADGSISSVFQLDRIMCDQDSSPVIRARLNSRLLITEDVFVCLANKISIIFNDAALVSYLAQLAISLANYKVGQYGISLILSWFVIESILSKLWNQYLEDANCVLPDGSKRINSPRMANLTKDRDYPISVISNCLELAGEIQTDMFKEVDIVRGWRNKVIHRHPGFECSKDHCVRAIKLALRMSLFKSSLDVEIPIEFAFRIIGP